MKKSPLKNGVHLTFKVCRVSQGIMTYAFHFLKRIRKLEFRHYQERIPNLGSCGSVNRGYLWIGCLQAHSWVDEWQRSSYHLKGYDLFDQYPGLANLVSKASLKHSVLCWDCWKLPFLMFSETLVHLETVFSVCLCFLRSLQSYP